MFQLPTALAYPLFYKLAQPGASTVSLQAVQSWIVQQKVMQVCLGIFCHGVLGCPPGPLLSSPGSSYLLFHHMYGERQGGDRVHGRGCPNRLCAAQVEPVVRMFDILRSEGRNWVVQGDLKSMLAGILLSHPGLEFLQDTPEFQDRYAETVILRIFYSLDRSGLGRITLRDLKRCGLRASIAVPSPAACMSMGWATGLFLWHVQ